MLIKHEGEMKCEVHAKRLKGFELRWRSGVLLIQHISWTTSDSRVCFLGSRSGFSTKFLQRVPFFWPSLNLSGDLRPYSLRSSCLFDGRVINGSPPYETVSDPVVVLRRLLVSCAWRGTTAEALQSQPAVIYLPLLTPEDRGTSGRLTQI